ncbi:hypothetical protein MAR_027768, partial [Mya arenaria]
MSRNRGYRGDESDKGLQENRRDPRVSQKHAQEVFYTEGSQESIPMQQMSPGGPPHMQDPGLSQGYITPSIESIIAKRVLTVAVLIFNETLNWLQYCDWIGTINLPPVFGHIGKKSKTDVVECSADAPFLPSIYGLFCGIATVYALLQIINTIGETVLEYHARKSGTKYEDTGSSQSQLPQNSAQPGPLPQDRSQNQPETNDEDPERQGEEEQKSIKQRCFSIFYGFQLLHGWVETVAAMVVEDLPQLIVMAVSSYYCTVNLENAFREKECIEQVTQKY